MEVYMNNKKPKHLIIISFDAISSLDFNYISNLPNFKAFLHNGSYCKNVLSVYPSLTYPAHTTIITGKYPVNHGIINNTLFQPGNSSPDWYWFRKYIKGDTLYDLANNAGMTTAALLWPVTGKSKVTYNMPEIFANRWWQNQILTSLLSGSKYYQFDMNNKYGNLRQGLKQPHLDNFVLASAVHTIINKKPNLMLIHFTDLDTHRHIHGFSSEEAYAALRRHDERLGELIKALKQAGIYQDSAVIALGDHSALDENKVINLNVLFREQGLIHIDDKGNLKYWKAYVKSCDGSAYVYLKKSDDTDTFEKVNRLVHEFASVPSNGIEKIYSSKEAHNLGADKNCSFMLEAKIGFYFLEDSDGTVIKEIKEKLLGVEKHYTKATHGYSPYKPDYTTLFIASGAGVKPNVVIDSMTLADEAPTFAELLRLNFVETDGGVLSEILY
jgi:predicted AlkP superfamily pyrophosphatase or phosphodiesterase